MDSVEQTKACTKCGEVKAWSEYAPRPDRPLGIQSRCRECQRAGRLESKAKYQAKWNATKREKYASDEEYRAKLQAGCAKWREANREYAAAKTKEWLKANAEHSRKWHREHRLANLEAHTARERAYHAANRERERPARRQRTAKRRALMRNAKTFTITPKDLRRLLASPCVWPECTNTDIQLDHIIPVSRGGDHGIGNLQPLCRHHNYSKNDKTWAEFRVYMRQKMAATS